MSRFRKSLVWFRRDLRCFDHAALYHALTQSDAVFCLFIFDKEILDRLPRADRRVAFIRGCVEELDRELRDLGGGLLVKYATASEEVPRVAALLGVDAVFASRDYEPAALRRDGQVESALQAQGRSWLSYKDQVIFEKDEVMTLEGRPFSVFTPYKKAWLKKLFAGDNDFYLTPYPVHRYVSRLSPVPPEFHETLPTLDQLRFSSGGPIPAPGMAAGVTLSDDFMTRIDRYHEARDFPAIKGPSYLSVHLRFGTVSIRALARRAVEHMRTSSSSTGPATWLSELIWRDFYFMILYHHPHVAERAFRPAYDKIRWEAGARAEELFRAWCDGRTGYPLVDAAMAQLNQTGYMHNRLRMVTASFLMKDLGIDWRWGERYFARQLNDYDLAANNGGWQWAASSGCDAQPYFRIFNPVTQSERFDPDGKFIRRYLPQLSAMPTKYVHAPWLMPRTEAQRAGIDDDLNYPMPIVDHEEARRATLARYAVVKQRGNESATQ